MKSKETTLKEGISGYKHTELKWSGLQFRMAVSYALTTLVAVLLIEILLEATIVALLLYSPLANDPVRGARQTAGLYALEAALQARGTVLDPHTTFEPGQPSSIALPAEDYAGNPANASYIPTSSPAAQPVTFALLIAPDGRVFASSYPARYPVATSVAHLLPNQFHLIMNALAGVAASTVEVTGQGRTIYVVEPVWTREKQEIGAIYLQVPEFSGSGLLQGFTLVWLISGVFWLVITLPVGGLFGLLTTRGLVRRLRQLVTATTRFADGDYTQRVQISRRDEVGQLEEHFNRMAQQLVESITQRQALAEQNARLAERNRIARDLHDSVKQQAFAVSMQISAALALLDQHKEAAHTHMLEAETLAYQVQQELTTLIQELRSSALQDRGLAAVLSDYGLTWSRQHSITAAVSMPDTCVLPLAVEEALLRIAQEALSNVARHSHATTVQISLECDQEQVVLRIADNGQGFNPDGVNGSGVGLHSMRERMEALGGTVVIESTVGQGTRLIARCASAQPQG